MSNLQRCIIKLRSELVAKDFCSVAEAQGAAVRDLFICTPVRIFFIAEQNTVNLLVHMFTNSLTELHVKEMPNQTPEPVAAT